MATPIRSLWPDDEPATECSPQGPDRPAVNLSSRLWRSGNLLVMDRQARLPDVCLLTGRPATHRVERELNYYPAGCHLFLLLGIIPYLIFTMFLSTVAKIEFGLCERCYERQRWRLVFGKLLGAVGAAGILGSIALGMLTGAHEFAIVGIFFSALVGIAGLAIGFLGSCLVITYKIDSDYIWLLGVDRDFLATLPDWQSR